MARFVPRGSGGGAGFLLGPEQNTFGSTAGTLNAAIAARNTYAGANAAWLATYDAKDSLFVRLLHTGGATYQSRIGGAWVTQVGLAQGRDGNPGPQGRPGESGSYERTIFRAADDVPTTPTAPSSVATENDLPTLPSGWAATPPSVDDNTPIWASIQRRAAGSTTVTYTTPRRWNGLPGTAQAESAVRSIIAGYLHDGAGIQITQQTDSLTIASTVVNTDTQLSPEQVQDIVAAFVRAGAGISIVYDDDAHTLTFSEGAAPGNGAQLLRHFGRLHRRPGRTGRGNQRDKQCACRSWLRRDAIRVLPTACIGRCDHDGLSLRGWTPQYSEPVGSL